MAASEESNQTALIITSKLPSLSLLDALRLSGYSLHFETDAARGITALRRGLQPKLAVVSELDSSEDLPDLLSVLATRSVRVVVTTDDGEAAAHAQRHGFLLRGPAMAHATSPA